MAKKQKSIKKQAKTNKGKFGLKKLDFKKNWKKLSYLGLAGFLAVSSIGYAGWDKFKQVGASAASYSPRFLKTSDNFCITYAGQPSYHIAYAPSVGGKSFTIYFSTGNGTWQAYTSPYLNPPPNLGFGVARSAIKSRSGSGKRVLKVVFVNYSGVPFSDTCYTYV
jgi:hypothetical protein